MVRSVGRNCYPPYHRNVCFHLIVVAEGMSDIVHKDPLRLPVTIVRCFPAAAAVVVVGADSGYLTFAVTMAAVRTMMTMTMILMAATMMSTSFRDNNVGNGLSLERMRWMAAVL